MGDRFDAYRLKNLDSLHSYMPYLYPKRCDAEAYFTTKIEMDKALDYIREKAQTGEKVTLFQLVVSAMVKTIALRPKLNRYILSKRIYQRYKIPVAFIAKREFSDEGEESIITIQFDENATLASVREKITNKVGKAREGSDSNASMDAINVLVKMPRFINVFVMWVMKKMVYFNIFPKSLLVGDPHYSAVFITNLGSIKCDPTYHHLNEWGTNSIFLAIGRLHKERVYDEENDDYEVRNILDVAVTLDERIADGFYYIKSINLLKHLLNNPELLETRAGEEINYE